LVLRRWFYSHLLQPGAGVAANYKIRRYFNQLGDIGAPQPEMFPVVYLIPDTIVRLNKSQDNRFKALQCMMSMTVSKDLITTEPLDRTEIEYHHIFPKAMNRSHDISKPLLDCVSNRIALSKKSNKKLGDKPPFEYFKEVRDKVCKAGTLPGLQHHLTASLIPGDVNDEFGFLSQFQPNNIGEFLHKRAHLIQEHIKTILGDSLTAKEPEDFDE